jgi:hypothetical protein
VSNEHGGGAEVQVKPRLSIKMNRHEGVEQNGDECKQNGPRLNYGAISESYKGDHGRNTAGHDAHESVVAIGKARGGYYQQDNWHKPYETRNRFDVHVDPSLVWVSIVSPVSFIFLLIQFVGFPRIVFRFVRSKIQIDGDEPSGAYPLRRAWSRIGVRAHCI